MVPVRALLLTLAFALELAVLTASGAAAAALPVPTAGRVGAAVVAVVAMATAWGVFGSPRARVPLRAPAGWAFRISWYGVGVVAAVLGCGPRAGVLLAALVVLDHGGLSMADRLARRSGAVAP